MTLLMFGGEQTLFLDVVEDLTNLVGPLASLAEQGWLGPLAVERSVPALIKKLDSPPARNREGGWGRGRAFGQEMKAPSRRFWSSCSFSVLLSLAPYGNQGEEIAHLLNSCNLRKMVRDSDLLIDVLPAGSFLARVVNQHMLSDMPTKNHLADDATMLRIFDGLES
ncbi:MAG: hypothetical protein U0V87_08145 [Acidobacteriota bacterium]